MFWRDPPSFHTDKGRDFKVLKTLREYKKLGFGLPLRLDKSQKTYKNQSFQRGYVF